jgi:NitT/TauT family transport system ATP-binding protein
VPSVFQFDRLPVPLLASRLVLSQRPARILTEIAVDLLYPRHRSDQRFTALRREALAHLGLAST